MRVWTEDATPEKRPSVNRVKEALNLGVEVIATACPFCVTTLEDAVKVLDVEDKIVVKDILELLKEVVWIYHKSFILSYLFDQKYIKQAREKVQ